MDENELLWLYSYIDIDIIYIYTAEYNRDKMLAVN